MIKILNTKQIKELDQATIRREPISSIDLMERACKAFVTWFTPQFDVVNKIGVVCGTGNNGGDGLGIARILSDLGYRVSVFVVRGDASESEDFRSNLGKLTSKITIREIRAKVHEEWLGGFDVLIDAIFGSGLSRPVSGIYADVINGFNRAGGVRIAVDIPSGLMADEHTAGIVVQADHTITFHLPKVAFMMPENAQRVGVWDSVGIGLDKDFLKETPAKHFYLTLRDVRKRLPRREKFSHKGDFGRVLLAAGSLGKMGACVLAARAALRSGAGLLTAFVPRCGYSIIQTAVPEAMALIDTGEEFLSGRPDVDAFDVIGIGPGIGTRKETASAFRTFLEAGKPMVIDADALNILGLHRDWLKMIPAGSILTPHPGEFGRLVGNWKNDFERLDKQVALSAETGSVVVLKGAHTSIAVPDGAVYFNSTGNPGMATGGSGDVLTGVLTGLMAQGYNATDAALVGVFQHGLAGDLAAAEKGMISLVASDIVDFLARSFQR